MDLKSIIKKKSLWIIFVSILILPDFGIAYTAEFEIEEIITAIKQDIQTARMTGSGSHNGMVIHEDVELSGPTRGPLFQEERPTGPLRLQGDHGPVAYRNIWVRPLACRSQ